MRDRRNDFSAQMKRATNRLSLQKSLSIHVANHFTSREQLI